MQHVKTIGEEKAGSRLFRQNKPFAPRSNTTPWLKQKMKRSSSAWIGLPNSRADSLPTPDQVSRSDWGGILDPALWSRLYEANAAAAGFEPSVGKYLDAQSALKRVRDAIAAEATPPGAGPFSAKADQSPEDHLIGAELGDRTVWDSGAGGFSPFAGCATKFAQEHGLGAPLANEFSPGEDYGASLLPLVLSGRTSRNEDDQLAIDKACFSAIDTRALEPWPEEMGLPTVVTPIEIVWQGWDDDLKSRMIVDYRYVNSAVPTKGMEVPSTLSIAKKAKANARFAKQDLKAGFHQLKMKEQDRHLCAIIWRGKLYAFTCSSFGVRSSPEFFQAATSSVARRMDKELAVDSVDVYIDDFVEDVGRETEENIVNFISAFGFVMGKKKVLPASTEQDVLGLIIDTVKMGLYAPEKKLERVIKLLESLGKKPLDSVQLSGLLGLMVSLEPAIPMLLLFSRPLYDDLKDALCGVGAMSSNEDIPNLMREKDKSNYVWSKCPVALSEESLDMATWLSQNIRRLNGQSLKRLVPSALSRSDASEKGFGGITVGLEKDGSVREPLDKIEVAGSLPVHLLEASSLDREAYGFAETILALPDRIVRDAVLVGGNDNKGLVCRYWVGARSKFANRALIRMAIKLSEMGAVLQCMYWMPREYMGDVDGLSRKETPSLAVGQVKSSWFEEWSSQLVESEKPNVDAFATRSNAVLARFASLEGDGTYFDGVSAKWSAEDVPWCFPPVGIIKPSLKNWIASPSKLSYWCLPRLFEGAWWTSFRKSKLTDWESSREVEVINGERHWKYILVVMRKNAL